jgi:hypothetical protein
MKILALVSLLLASFGTQAYSITDNGSTIDVGGLDTFLSAAPKAGSITAEEAWIESIVGTLDFIRKDETLTAFPTIEDTEVLAVDIVPGDDYYVLKNATYMAAFENVVEIDWAVFDTGATITITELVDDVEVDTTAAFSEFFNLGDQVEVSHITLFDSGGGGGGGGGGGIDQVPVPAPLALIGLGVLGLGFTRRFLA